MKDCFDHFQNKWVSFERKAFINTLKGIGAGILVSILMFACSLLILAGIIK